MLIKTPNHKNSPKTGFCGRINSNTKLGHKGPKLQW